MSDVVAYEFTAPLTVCVDFKNPHSYLAIEPTYALADEFEIDVEWLPFAAAAIQEPQPMAPDDDRGARHRKMRSAYFERDLARYADIRGLTLKGVFRDPDVTAAGIGLLWIGKQGQALTRQYLNRVFEGHFAETFDLTSSAGLASLIGDLGADAADFEAFRAGAGAELYRSLQASLRATGIANVPAYWIDDALYYGRQHLPMLRWILSGRGGPGPI